MTRVAAFDCGTNSLRLLVADLDRDTGQSHELVREMRIVRLGQGVDRTGRISEEAMRRVLEALDEFTALVEQHAVEAIRFCATSAARDAENASELVDAVRERLGVEPEVLDGDAEARASYDGATRSLGVPLDPPYLVVDIGGGSTELILGDADGTVRAAQSLDIGSVRLTERHLASNPPQPDEIAAATQDVEAVLDTCEVDLAAAGAVIGVAGTITTLAAGTMGLERYERDLIHHSVHPTAALVGTVGMLMVMGVEERRALGYMHPGRADVIAAGGLILDRVLRRTNVSSLLVSENDILDGIAWSMVGDADEDADS